jgi:hypothetical protein
VQRFATPQPVLNSVSFWFEFEHRPPVDTVESIAKALTRPGDLVSWEEVDAEDVHLETTQYAVEVAVNIRPCASDSGIEGSLHDGDPADDPDVPSELVERFALAKRQAEQHGAEVTDGQYESELATTVLSWEDLRRTRQ